MFRCHYCNITPEFFEDTVTHCIDFHPEQILRIQRKSLDNKTGLFGWQSLNFQVIPSIINKIQQKIVVDCRQRKRLFNQCSHR